MYYQASFGETLHTLLDHPYCTLRLAVVDTHIPAMTWCMGELRAVYTRATFEAFRTWVEAHRQRCQQP